MNHTLPFDRPAERRHLFRRPPQLTPGIIPSNPTERNLSRAELLWAPKAPGQTSSLGVDRRSPPDRRKTDYLERALPVARHRRVALVVLCALATVGGLKATLFQGNVVFIPVSRSPSNPERAQYVWRGYHRVPPANNSYTPNTIGSYPI